MNRSYVEVFSAILMASVVAFQLPNIGRAGAPEPPGTLENEHLKGPAIVGTATFTQNGAGADLTFVGTCKGTPITLNGTVTPLTVSDLTADDLENSRPGSISDFSDQLNGCHSGAGDLIINTVTRFTSTGSTASADIVVMAVVPQ